jgi:hypothetical protein
MPSMPSTEHDLTIQPLDSTTASPTRTRQIEVYARAFIVIYLRTVSMSDESKEGGEEGGREGERKREEEKEGEREGEREGEKGMEGGREAESERKREGVG